MLIESQMKSSKAIFKNMFKDAKNQEEFQKQAREYLKKLGILKSVSND
jgi:hypothetical protein